PKWQRRGGAASGSFGDDARNLLRLRLVSQKLWRDHSYLSLGFVRPQRHLVLAERVVLAERGLGSFGQHRMHWVAPAWVRSGESCSGGRNGSGSFGQGVACLAEPPRGRSAKFSICNGQSAGSFGHTAPKSSASI